MSLWTAKVAGWLIVVEASTHKEAVALARASAAGASLLPSDVHEAQVRPASVEDVDWYQSMRKGSL